MIKEESELEKLKALLEDKKDLIVGFLQSEDAKTRKNAALLIGDLEWNETVDELFEFYKNENGVFCNGVFEVEEYFNEHPLYEKETYAYKIHYLITLSNNERYVVSDEFYKNNFKKRVKLIKEKNIK